MPPVVDFFERRAKLFVHFSVKQTQDFSLELLEGLSDETLHLLDDVADFYISNLVVGIVLQAVQCVVNFLELFGIQVLLYLSSYVSNLPIHVILIEFLCSEAFQKLLQLLKRCYL